MLGGVDRRAVAGILAVLLSAACSGEPDTVSGVVVDGAGDPIPGATVRIQATPVSVVTGGDGTFEIPADGPVRISASAPGFYIGGGAEFEPGGDAGITLQPIPVSDHPGYDWLSVTGGGVGEDQGCVECHSAATSDTIDSLAVDQWRLDAHGGSATNPRFLTMYAGTDVAGNASPDTRYVSNPDYGKVPLAPDPALPYFGPGYRLDFPDTNGNCAACHLPIAAADDPYSVDPRSVGGVAVEGISCDFCHKVWDVRLDPVTRLPDPGMPGVTSFDLRRPPDGHQFFAGPFDDVAPGEDFYSPLQTESRYCAPCHSGVFWDTVVYDSYGEWLRSPYADPDTGMTCQDCHMPPTGEQYFALPSQGGLARDPASLHSHLMPGAADPTFLARALDLDFTTEHDGARVDVEVTVTNAFGGHHVPTDSPLRHVMLLVEGVGPDGNPLTFVDGPTLPDWCGTGDGPRSHGGAPGTVFAKVLEEVWTGTSPTGAYWNPTIVVYDTRIPALSTNTSRYTFDAPDGGTLTLRLVFRRAFIDLMHRKGWNTPDIEMRRFVVEIPAPGVD